MRQQVDDRFVRPPGLIVVKIVLRKTAGVHDAEMGVNARPAIGRRFAAIVETRPRKSAGQPWTVGEILPPRLGGVRPTRGIVVVGADVTAFLVIRIDSA